MVADEVIEGKAVMIRVNDEERTSVSLEAVELSNENEHFGESFSLVSYRTASSRRIAQRRQTRRQLDPLRWELVRSAK